VRPLDLQYCSMTHLRSEAQTCSVREQPRREIQNMSRGSWAQGSKEPWEFRVWEPKITGVFGPVHHQHKQVRTCVSVSCVVCVCRVCVDVDGTRDNPWATRALLLPIAVTLMTTNSCATVPPPTLSRALLPCFFSAHSLTIHHSLHTKRTPPPPPSFS
jgi:hypothetical protein